jgi:hypothetical protein
MQIQEYTYRADQPFYPKSVWWLGFYHPVYLHLAVYTYQMYSAKMQ